MLSRMCAGRRETERNYVAVCTSWKRLRAATESASQLVPHF